MNQRNLKRFKHFLNDPEKKPFLKIGREMISLWVSKRQFPTHYIGRFFYKKESPKNIYDYLTIQEYTKVNKMITEKNRLLPEVFEILENKLVFYNYCEAHNLPSPEVYSYNDKDMFYTNNRAYRITTIQGIRRFFYDIFENNQLKQLFIKTLRGSGGHNAFRLDRKKLNKNHNGLLNVLLTGQFVHQEVIKQHAALNTIYNNAINTIRLETFKGKDGNIQLLGAFMRFGAGGIEVDNASSGGLFINLNMKNGTLFKYARNKLVYGSKYFALHPDTGFKFEGFKIPFYSDAVKMVLELGKKLPCYVHGWDLAITNNGPTIIEGNHSPGFLNAEYSYHGYKNHPAFIEIMDDLKKFGKSG